MGERGGVLRSVGSSPGASGPENPLDYGSQWSSGRMEVEFFQGWNRDPTEGSPPSDSSFRERRGDWPKWPILPSDFGILTMFSPTAPMPVAVVAVAWPAPLQ